MKTLYKSITVSFLFILLCITSLSAQVPQKFNYQAVVRNSDGTIMATQNIGVQATIIKDSPGGTVVYTESHTISTNSLGLINLEIGGGTTGDDFTAVDWGNGDHFLKIEVDPAGGISYTDMGTTQLLSVPYALYSENSEPQALILDGNVLTISDGNTVTLPSVGTSNWTIGTGDTTLYRVLGNVGVGTDVPAGKLEVVGDGDETDDDALFEVKRSDGQAVFSVYPGGVQVYVDDDAKGAKGGFAIGGFSSFKKGLTNEFMRVTPDSGYILIQIQLKVQKVDLPSGVLVI